jgi:hypothetical protein
MCNNIQDLFVHIVIFNYVITFIVSCYFCFFLLIIFSSFLRTNFRNACL